MTQIILNVEDKTLLPGLRKILSSLNGVSISRVTHKGTLSRAVDEVRKGKVKKVNSVAELMSELESWSVSMDYEDVYVSLMEHALLLPRITSVTDG